MANSYVWLVAMSRACMHACMHAKEYLGVSGPDTHTMSKCPTFLLGELHAHL